MANILRDAGASYPNVIVTKQKQRTIDDHPFYRAVKSNFNANDFKLLDDKQTQIIFDVALQELDTEVITLLQKNKLNVNVYSERLDSFPLLFALERSVELADIVLAMGADVDNSAMLKHINSDNLLVEMMSQERFGAAELLVKNGYLSVVDPQSGINTLSFLMNRALPDDLKLAKILVNEQVNVYDAIALADSKYDWNSKNLYAAMHELKSQIKWELITKDVLKKFLSKAFAEKDYQTIREIGNVNGVLDERFTPLDDFPIVYASKNDLSLLAVILSNGANPDQRVYSNDATLLYEVAKQGNVDVAKVLIDSGANIGIAPQIAITHGNYDVAEYLQGITSKANQQSNETTHIIQTVKDKTKPIIEILTPKSERGLSRVERKGNQVLVSGIVRDDSSITKVTVNGNQARVSNAGHFTYNLTIPEGTANLIVSATDRYGNTSVKSMNVEVQSAPRGISSQLSWYKKQYAIVVGIDKYNNANIESLNNAVNDAKAIADMFEFMGYEVISLLNAEATKANILKALRSVKDKATEKDSFVFYFAGHGQAISDEIGDKTGFLMPYDSNTDLSSNDIFDYQYSAISLATIRQLTKFIKAKHIALLLDSCFSGLAMKRNMPKIEKPDLDYYRDMLNRKAINILTAGDDQPVSDGSGHSPFTRALLEGLKNAGLDVQDRDGLATFNELAVYVKTKVEKATNRRQRPQFDNLSNEDGGFLFNVEK